MYLLTNKKLKTFREKGILEFKELLNKNKCNKLYNKILNNRIWGKNLFKTEKNFLKNPQYRKTNPGKGKYNLAEKFDLSFIEKNKEIKRTLNKILGDEYDIVLKKFVVAVPEHWIPEWLKKKRAFSQREASGRRRKAKSVGTQIGIYTPFWRGIRCKTALILSIEAKRKILSFLCMSCA